MQPNLNQSDQRCEETNKGAISSLACALGSHLLSTVLVTAKQINDRATFFNKKVVIYVSNYVKWLSSVRYLPTTAF
jgi:hypothetical protein